MSTGARYCCALQRRLARVLDRVGSRPVIATGAVLFAVQLMLWWALAGGLLPYHVATLISIQVVAGHADRIGNEAPRHMFVDAIGCEHEHIADFQWHGKGLCGPGTLLAGTAAIPTGRPWQSPGNRPVSGSRRRPGRR